jgi:hypothetical protein
MRSTRSSRSTQPSSRGRCDLRLQKHKAYLCASTSPRGDDPRRCRARDVRRTHPQEIAFREAAHRAVAPTTDQRRRHHACSSDTHHAVASGQAQYEICRQRGSEPGQDGDDWLEQSANSNSIEIGVNADDDEHRRRFSAPFSADSTVVPFATFVERRERGSRAAAALRKRDRRDVPVQAVTVANTLAAGQAAARLESAERANASRAIHASELSRPELPPHPPRWVRDMTECRSRGVRR